MPLYLSSYQSIRYKSAKFLSLSGNTIRALQEDPEFWAEVTELPLDLIKGIITISIALRIGLPLDPFLFRSLCAEVKNLWYEVAPWAYMCPTLHKVLQTYFN